MVEDKEIVLAIFGGSLSVAALFLVFLGFTLSSYAALAARDVRSETILARLKTLVWVVLGGVTFGVIVAAFSLAWLLDWGLFDIVVGLFFALLVVMIALAIWTARALT